MDNDKFLRQQLVNLLTLGEAHATFDDAVNGLPAELRGKIPPGAEHSPWQVLEHLRITQSDILEFSRDANHQSPDWPVGYWPERPEPPASTAWDESIRAFHRDRQSLCGLINDPVGDLYARFPHGDGQTLLREALLAADHNAYHLGEMVLLRRLLGAWSKS
jgi:hypothetical protein